MVILTVLMFVCVAVYLNWSYNRGQEVPLSGNESGNEAANIIIQNESEKPSDKAQAEQSEDAGLYYVDEAEQTGGQSDEDYYSSYFATARLSRQQARDSAVELLQEAMSYEEPGSTTEASMQLTNLVSDALAEAQIESLVVAKGYTDCVAYMADGIISVAVSAPAEGLQQTDVAVISDIVTAQTDYDLTDLRIIEVK